MGLNEKMYLRKIGRYKRECDGKRKRVVCELNTLEYT